jgi:hypothetical protein
MRPGFGTKFRAFYGLDNNEVSEETYGRVVRILETRSRKSIALQVIRQCLMPAFSRHIGPHTGYPRGAAGPG